jgi:hypothetical protein
VWEKLTCGNSLAALGQLGALKKFLGDRATSDAAFSKVFEDQRIFIKAILELLLFIQ